VFILKVVKVLCFDTLLQVLILKGLTHGPRFVKNTLFLARAARKTGPAGRLRKAKTPAEMLALRAQDVLLPVIDGTRQATVCQEAKQMVLGQFPVTDLPGMLERGPTPFGRKAI